MDHVLPRFLLDTHVCLAMIRTPAVAADFFAQCLPGEVAISSLGVAALRARVRRSLEPERNERALEQFLLPLMVLDFDAEAAAWLGRLAAQAEQQGRTAGQEEMIAAQALAAGSTLVTSQPQLYDAILDLSVRVLTGPGSAGQPHAGLTFPVGVVSPATIRIAGSHDLTLNLLAGWLRTHQPGLTFSVENVGSLGGLLALQQGRAEIAGAHLLDEETGDFNRSYIQHLLTPLGVRVVLLGFVERVQGLLVRRGNPLAIHALEDLQRSDVIFVNRQRGAGTRMLLDFHLRRRGLDPAKIRGYGREETTHSAVAQAVLAGEADCGLGIFAAARAAGLDFVPLFEERYDLVIPVEHYGSARLAPLLALLRQPTLEFLQQIAALGGYKTTAMGQVLAEL